MIRATDDLHWIPAEDGYSLAIRGREIVARSAKGRVLASVPKALRDGDTASELAGLIDWLDRHEAECCSAIESWMLCSSLVPRAVVEAVWPDPSWRRLLDGALVHDLDASGHPLETGLLRGEGDEVLGIRARDGRIVPLTGEELAIPHPVLVDDLAAWRGLAARSGVAQGFEQVGRDAHVRDATVDPDEATAVHRYADARFPMIAAAIDVARSIGARVRSGHATCRTREGGRELEARFALGDGALTEESETGELVWVDEKGREVALRDVGPVAWSEGVRMAAAIFARRVDAGDDVGDGTVR